MKSHNKEKIIDAIEKSTLLSKSQKEILKYISSFDYQRGVTEISLCDYLNITKQAVNFSLKQLINRNFVKRYKDRVFIYQLNLNKLSEILEDYDITNKFKSN